MLLYYRPGCVSTVTLDKAKASAQNDHAKFKREKNMLDTSVLIPWICDIPGACRLLMSLRILISYCG